jgi:hypothetical protein
MLFFLNFRSSITQDESRKIFTEMGLSLANLLYILNVIFIGITAFWQFAQQRIFTFHDYGFSWLTIFPICALSILCIEIFFEK